MQSGHYFEPTFGPLLLGSLGLVGLAGFASTCVAVLIRRRFGVLALWAWALLPGLLLGAITASEWSDIVPGPDQASTVLAVLALGIAIGLAPAAVIVRANKRSVPSPYWTQVKLGTAAVFASILTVGILGIAAITLFRLASR